MHRSVEPPWRVLKAHPVLVTLVFVGGLVEVPAGVLLAAGYSHRPKDTGLVGAGWVCFGVGLALALVSNFALQRARARDRGVRLRWW